LIANIIYIEENNMAIGMYLNSVICLVAAIFSFNTAWYIYKKSKKDFFEISYASFWLFIALNWLFFAISLIFFKEGFIGIALLINQYAVQVFAFAQVISVSYFLFYRLTKNKIFSLLGFSFFLFFFFVGIFLNFRPGSVYLTLSSYYSFEYAIDNTYWQIFQVLFFLNVLAAGIDFFRNLFYWFRKGPLFDNKYFFTSFSIIIYAMIGYFDESGLTATWISALFRLAIALCAYLALVSYKDKEDLNG
jgi:hypothetical protein